MDKIKVTFFNDDGSEGGSVFLPDQDLPNRPIYVHALPESPVAGQLYYVMSPFWSDVADWGTPVTGQPSGSGWSGLNALGSDAGVLYGAAPGRRIVKSTTDGTSWTVEGGYPSGLQGNPPSIDRTGDNLYLLAKTGDDFSADEEKVYMSSDDGGSWNAGKATPIMRESGGFNLSADDGKIYIFHTSTRRAWKSTNHGETWTEFDVDSTSSWFYAPNAQAIKGNHFYLTPGWFSREIISSPDLGKTLHLEALTPDPPGLNGRFFGMAVTEDKIFLYDQQHGTLHNRPRHAGTYFYPGTVIRFDGAEDGYAVVIQGPSVSYEEQG